MTIVLLFIGLVAIAVGFVTIGFGIPTNPLSFGNTLIDVGQPLGCHRAHADRAGRRARAVAPDQQGAQGATRRDRAAPTHG